MEKTWPDGGNQLLRLQDKTLIQDYNPEIKRQAEIRRVYGKFGLLWLAEEAVFHEALASMVTSESFHDGVVNNC